MTPFRLSLLSAAIVCSIAPSFADQTSPVYGIRDKTPHLLAFTNATVHTEPGKTLDNATVLVVDGKISAVGSSAVPAGYRKIDATGHHLYAGFIDAYSSYGIEKAAGEKAFEFGGKPVYQNSRKGGNASNGAIHAEQQWVNSFVPSTEDAKAYQQQGFTAVQSARFDGIFRGQSFVASLANGLPGELILKANGPQFMAFGKGSSKQSYPSSLMGSIALIRQTLSDANWYRDAFGKQDQLQSRQPVEFNAALSALTTLEQSGLVFETTDDRALLRVDSLLKEFNLKNVVLLGSGYEYSRVADIKNTGRTVIVPVAYPAAPAVANIDDQLDVSLADLRHWERAPTNLAVMAKAGVPFALTTHALEKKDQFWPNLRQAMKHGLTAEQALAGLTTVPAKLVGLPEQLGKIAVGYQADLVIAKGDLFADGEIVSTWTRGQEQQFKPLKPVEFAGTYAVDLAGKTLTLELSGRGDKLSGKLKQADKHSELKNVQQKQQQLQFTVDLAAAEAGTGVLQFQGVLDGNLLNGQWLLPSGQTQKVMLSKQAATAKAEDSKNGDKKADAVDTKLVSMLTFPNRAFGTQLAQGRQNAHIKNATVWTSDKAGKLENTDVIIKDGKFSKIGENLSTPSGYQVIDATGMHLTAGIIDEHSHIAIEAGVNEGTDAVTSEVQIGDVLNPEDINIYRGLAGGTTTAQLLHGSANPIGGQAQVIQLRWGVTPEQLKFKDAPPSIKFALGENVKQANWGEAFTSRYPQSRIGVETTIRDAFQAAKEYKAAFAAYDDLSRGNKDKVAPPRRDFRLQALVEILDKQRFVHTHSYVASEILMLIHLADEVGFKIHTFTHILEGYKVADEMAKHGASASSFADWWAYKMEVQDAIPTNTCLMADRGVMVSINSDSPDLQRRLNQEAAKSVKYCGMSEIDALNMVTINPAKQLNIQDKVGSITEGKQADFVLWTHHPLSVYAQAKQTWIDGIRYYDQERDAQVAAQVVAEKQQLMQKVLGASDKAKQGSGGAVKKDDPIWHCEDNGDWLHAKFSQAKFNINTVHTKEHPMKFQKSVFALLLAAAALPALANDIVPGAKQSAPILLKGGTLHTVSQGVLENSDLLMVDGKIAAIGNNLTAPADAKVIDVTGKHLYPGLIALANQLGLIEIEAVRATDDTNEVTDTNPDLRARIAYNADSEVIPTVRANGFSYSLVYPKGSALMGQSSLMQLDAWNWQDATVADGVGLHINWPSASVATNWWNKKKPEEIAKENAKRLQQVKDYFVQAKSYVDAEAAGLNKGVDSRWQAMIPVFKGERPLFVHADDIRQIKQAVLLAKEYQLKLVIVGGRDSWRMADELAAAKVAVIFTAPYGIPERDDEANNTAFKTPALLQKAGVQFALSLDGYWDTRNVVFGAGQAISYGLTPEQALASVTINAATIAGVEGQIGSLDVGKAASVVVSDGDIFDYLTHKVRYMWIDGRAVDLNNRNQQLHDKYKQRPAG